MWPAGSADCAFFNERQKMKRFFEQELKVLRSHLVQMGQMAVEQVKAAVGALENHDAELAAKVRAGDDELDRLEMEIDAEATRYMSLRSPVGGDLRLLIVAIKAGHDLERVGDEAANIAKRVQKRAGPVPSNMLPTDLQQMSKMVLEMLQDALDALLQGDTEKALSVCRRDETVDELNKRVYRLLTAQMIDQPQIVPVALEWILSSKAIERIGDHATNVAEEVVFLLRGEDIRHSGAVKKG